MTNVAEPTILGADRLAGSLIISFSDGRSGCFSASLLYANLQAATELFVPDDDAEEITVTPSL